MRGSEEYFKTQRDVTILAAEVSGDEYYAKVLIGEEESEMRYVHPPSGLPFDDPAGKWLLNLGDRNPGAHMILRQTFAKLRNGEPCEFPIFVPKP
jgi:hypothetical protein